MIHFIYLGVSPGSCTIACTPPPQPPYNHFPWTSSTSTIAICTPQTETKPRQLSFQFCTPNAPLCSFSCLPPTTPSNLVCTPPPAPPPRFSPAFFNGLAISSACARYLP